MKKTFTFLFILITASGYSQITINASDFASAGDNILVSNGTIVPQIDITTTGANQTWDFSYLTPFVQDTLEFLDVSSTAATYALFYINVAINSNRSNIATAAPPIPTIPQVPITISNPFNFYYKNSTQYKLQGIGAEINGFPTPIPYSNKDILYNYPMNFGDADSSDSDWNIGLTGVGYYGYTQHRTNSIDGWGTVITPFGSFNSLRVKTEIFGTDTVHIDTLGFGFGIDRPQINEYKWFAQGMEVPVLQINTSIFFGFETVTEVIYRDSLRSLGLDENNNTGNNLVSIYPNPALNTIYISTTRGIEIAHIEIFDASCRNAKEITPVIISGKIIINTSKLTSGIYFLKITDIKGNTYTGKFIRE